MANQIKTESTKYSLAHPFIYNKSFANNSWTCLLWRLLACLKCSISISQLSLKFFQCLNNNKYEILQTFRNIFLWMAFTMQTQRHKISGKHMTDQRFKDISNPTYRTGTFRVDENNPQNLLNCYLIPLLIKLGRGVT